MFKISRLLVIWLFLVAITGYENANAFAPKDYLPSGLTQNYVGKSHAFITRESVEEVQVSIYGPTSNMGWRFASDEIEKANANVDKDYKHNGFAHFDGESFKAGQDWILGLRKELLDALRIARDATTARERLGQALHAIQDFYSHTNWIDRGLEGIVNDQLGVKDVAIVNTAPKDSDTCNGSYTLQGVGQSSLTSGYFGGEPVESLPLGFEKCLHGGLKDTLSPAGYGINKDTLSTLFTTNVDKHPAAAATAKMASVKFMKEIVAELSSEETDLLFGGERITITNTSPVTIWTVDLQLDSEDSYPVSLFPGGKWFYPSLPEVSSAGLHTITITGIDSTSSTGFVLYRLHLPAHLEFVCYSTNLSGSTTFPISSGQEFSNRLLLHPVNFAPPERIHTIKIRVVDPGSSKTCDH